MNLKVLKSSFLVGSTVFWLAMTHLLIQKEYFQFTPLTGAYEVLPLQDWDLRQEYHAIYLGKERVGFNWNILEKKSEDEYELRHSTYMNFLFLGQAREMLIKETAHLDRQLNIKDFTSKISSSGSSTEIEGQMAKNNLNVVIKNTGSDPARQIFPVSGSLFFAEALDFIWTPENLQPGKQGVIKTWNALAMSAQDIQFKVGKKEKIPYDGGEQEAFLITLTVSGLELRCWVSPQGVVLREESAAGLLFEKEEAYKIFDAMRKNRATPPDLPNLFSIPSSQVLDNPAALTYLKAKIHDGKEDRIVEIRRPGPQEHDALTIPLAAPSEELTAALQPDPFVASQDPAITSLAREITQGETSAWKASLKINEWVHKNIEPAPTISLPQAVEVLRTRKGDCNEYTVLFTALARAAGIPARMQAGIVYQNGRFFYHAWPEVFTGRWISLDPTFDQAPADVTHIPLAKGGLSEQVNLASQIGRIKIQVLETSENQFSAGDTEIRSKA